MSCRYVVSWEAAKDALAHGENGLVLGSTAAAVAIVWCVASALTLSVTVSPQFMKSCGVLSGADSEVIPVGSLVGQVTPGSGPYWECSMLLALGVMDRSYILRPVSKKCIWWHDFNFSYDSWISSIDVCPPILCFFFFNHIFSSIYENPGF